MLPPTHEEEELTLEDVFPQMVYAPTRTPSFKTYPRHAKNQPNLCVTFEIDDNQQVRNVTTEAASPSSKFATKECRRDLWWSRHELMKIWKREKSLCDFYRRSSDEYADQVRQVFSRCRSASTKNLTISPSMQTETQDAHLLAVRSSNRGLEHRVVTILHVHRRKVLQGVLDQQAKVAHLTSHIQRQRMIRSRSMFLSHPAQQFALVVAHADAIAAQSALEENHRDKITLEQFSESFRLSESFRKTAGSFRWGESFRLNGSFRVI